MRINVAIPEEHVTAPVLDAALESVTRLNESMLERGEVPSFSTGVKHGVQWKPEPPGQEHFDHALEVIHRKWGDCDDLAPWQAASLRHSGADPGARAVAKRSGPKRWHAVVERSDGSIEDPSKRAGMGHHPGIIGACQPLMFDAPAPGINGVYIVRPTLAVRPVPGGVEARTDIPWYWHKDGAPPTPTDYAMATLHRAPTLANAMIGSIDGAIELAECSGYASDQDLSRLACISDACLGYSPDELAGIYSDDDVRAAQNIVGSFFSHLAHMARDVASPLAHAVVPFIPGVGPVLDKGLSFAEQAMHPGAAAASPMPGGGAGGGFGPFGPGRGFQCRFF